MFSKPICRRLFSRNGLLPQLMFFLFVVHVLVWTVLNQFGYCGDLLGAPRTTWPPKGQAVKCDVTRDVWLSSVGEERIGNNGGATRLKLKGHQEYILLDIDESVLHGKIITGSLLHIRSATPIKAPLARVGISTLARPWVEGTSRDYEPQKGSSCFDQAAYKEKAWAYSGSTLMDVCFGRGNTIWKFADCTPPDLNCWQTCAVAPTVVSARVAGISSGFCIYDEVGSSWSYKSGEFKYQYSQNRLCFSRESGTSGPWMEVWVSGEDHIPPEPITSIDVDIEEMLPGEAFVIWKTPKDRGGGKTIGFHVSYTRNGRMYPVPRYLIPTAGQPGEKVQMHLQDLAFKPGDTIDLIVKSVDSAGNVSEPFAGNIRLSSNLLNESIPREKPEPFLPSKRLPEVGPLRISVIDLLDKIDPQSGNMIPEQKAGYTGGNHLFSSGKKTIRLQAARNERVSFQLHLEGIGKDISVEYTFDRCPNLRTQLFEFAYVESVNENGDSAGYLPDPLLPVKGTFSIPSTAGQVEVPGQKHHSLICELYVPHGESAGEKQGKVTIAANGRRLDLDVDLTVWNFTLPNKLSFVPEMNAYHAVSPYRSYEYYRLAHEHRTCINGLPYGWDGIPAFAPTWRKDGFDWSEWDQKVGPLLDGSAFWDLPRSQEPVDVLYLPFNENWPVNLYEHYRPSYWADEAFSKEYPRILQRAFCSFASHCNEKEWHNTIFQFYLNNKVYFRKNFKQSSAPWIFDEPVNTQDFWALRWYGLLWHLAVNPVRKNTNMWFRGDVSYTQFSRNMLWGIMNIEYIGENDIQKTRMKLDEGEFFPSRFMEYGSVNKIKSSNVQPVAWCLSAWCKGAMGVLPWQTIGNQKSWKVADRTALFYPNPKGPKPSIRLKAFTCGQQGVEYLAIYCDVYKEPRHAMAAWLKEMTKTRENVDQSVQGDTDVGKFSNLDSTKLWEIRYRIGKMLSQQGPAYKRSLVDWKAPPFDSKKLPDIGYVSVSPEVQRFKPDCKNFTPQ